MELKHNIDEFLAKQKVKYPRKSVSNYYFESITSIKNLVEEWDVRKFSLPKYEKFSGDEDSELSLGYHEPNKSNIFSLQKFDDEENIIKMEFDKKFTIYLPAK